MIGERLHVWTLLPLFASALQDPLLDSGTAILPEQACYDVLHYDLAVRVDPKEKSIDGTLAMRAKVLTASDEVLLDLDARLEVKGIELAGKKTDFLREGGRIRVASPTAFHTPGEEFVLSVTYGGKPREAPNPPWDGGFTWSKTKDDKPWIATSCQGEGADLWWPCKDQPGDEPDTMDIRVSVPKPLVCASNGRSRRRPRRKVGARTTGTSRRRSTTTRSRSTSRPTS
jgi:aminopeptidase N